MAIQTVLDGFYEEILARVTTQVPELKTFNIYYGQYDNPQLDNNGNPVDPEFNRPAVFLQWPKSMPLTPLGLRRKTTDIVFVLHLVCDVFQEIDKRTPLAIREKAHLHTDLINKLSEALEGYNGNQTNNFKHFGAISLVEISPYEFIGQHIVHKLLFGVRLVVDATKKFYTRLDQLSPPVAATDIITSQIIPLGTEEL